MFESLTELSNTHIHNITARNRHSLTLANAKAFSELKHSIHQATKVLHFGQCGKKHWRSATHSRFVVNFIAHVDSLLSVSRALKSMCFFFGTLCVARCVSVYVWCSLTLLCCLLVHALVFAMSRDRIVF